MKVEPIFVTWPEVILRPNQFDVDLAIASITITPDREKEVLFSIPYWQTKLAVVQSAHKSGNDDLFKPVEFSNLKVGVHRDTTAQEFLEKVRQLVPNVSPVVARDNPELFDLLEDRKVDAIVYDFDRTLVERRNHPEWCVRQIDYDALEAIGLDYLPEQYGIVFARLNDEFRDDVDRILEAPDFGIHALMQRRLAPVLATRDLSRPSR